MRATHKRFYLGKYMLDPRRNESSNKKFNNAHSSLGRANARWLTCL